jgi:membrane protein DedA with SNARE-associated domain
MNPSSVMRWLEGLQGPLPYAALFGVAFLEHALLIGTLVPGEVILPLAGVAATTGALAWLPAGLCASAGGFLADQLAYWLARSWTTRRDERAPDRAEGRFARPAAMVRELYRRHGVWMLVLGRFVAGVAPFVAPGAGWAGMAYRRFLPANALANFLWGPVMVGVGYLFGIQAARLEGPWRWGGIAATAALFGLVFLRLRAIGQELAHSAGAATGPRQGRR